MHYGINKLNHTFSILFTLSNIIKNAFDTSNRIFHSPAALIHSTSILLYSAIGVDVSYSCMPFGFFVYLNSIPSTVLSV